MRIEPGYCRVALTLARQIGWLLSSKIQEPCWSGVEGYCHHRQLQFKSVYVSIFLLLECCALELARVRIVCAGVLLFIIYSLFI